MEHSRAGGGTGKPHRGRAPGAAPPGLGFGGPTLLPEWVTSVLDAGASGPRLMPMRLVPGQLVPGTRYVISRWLGDGGMGVVYEAQHADVGRRVALKILRPEVCEHPEVVDRFRNEARAANRVGSEHVTEVYDFAELEDGRLMFAMELLEGKTLAAQIAEGAMPVGRTIGILRQLCKGLGEAHDAGIVHRDVKPDNLMLVRRRRRPDFVKIMDLGIATLLVDGRAVASRMAGTPHYVAPEIVAGRSFDHRVDIYSVGCTAYEMLTGRPPFEGDSITAVLLAHLEREPQPLGATRSDTEIPIEVERIVLRCLAKHPEDRFSDARDLEAALCEAQIEAGLHTQWDDLPVPDVEDARKERLLREMPDPRVLDRPSSLAWLWPTLSVLAAGGVLAAGWYWSPSRQLTQIEEDRVLAIGTQARAAAAHSLYVYPAPDDPDAPTAYGYVLEMEALEGPVAAFADEQAALLRRDFAQTLNRLGDRYWAAEGGRVFASDYYVQALVFDAADAHAQARANTSSSSVVALQEKAGRGEFSEDDLMRAEPLVVLAEDDPEERREKLTQLRERGEARVFERQERIEKLAAVDAASLPSAPAADPAHLDQLVELARKNLSVGNATQAEKLLEEAIASDPRHAPALIGLSDVRFAGADYEQAALLAARAVEVAPRRAQYRVRLGRAYEQLGRAEEAAEQYARAEQLNTAGSGE